MAKPLAAMEAEATMPRCSVQLLLFSMQQRQMLLSCSETITKDRGGSGHSKLYLCQLWLNGREISKGSNGVQQTARSAAAEAAMEHLQVFQWHMPDRPPHNVLLATVCKAPGANDVESACFEAAEKAVGGGRVDIVVYDTRPFLYTARHAAEAKLQLFDGDNCLVKTIGGWGRGPNMASGDCAQRQAVLMAAHLLVRHLWHDTAVRPAFEGAFQRALERRNLTARFNNTAMQINALLSHAPALPPVVRI